MSVAYPQQGEDTLAISWPDMRESFPCESTTTALGFCGGANPAEWIMRLVHCCAWSSGRGYILACTQCKDVMARGASSQCTRGCLKVYRPAITAYTSIEPLGVT